MNGSDDEDMDVSQREGTNTGLEPRLDSESYSSLSDSGDSDEVLNYDPDVEHRSNKRTYRGLRRSGADSIVGGQSMEDLYKSDDEDLAMAHAAAAQHRPYGEETEPQGRRQSIESSQKVFSFSLPFGGLSSLKSNLSKQLSAFKFDGHIPLLHESASEKEDPRTKLQRQDSLNTVQEADFFKRIKSVDDARLRAVKYSLASNLNEIIPDIKFSKRAKLHESIYSEIEGNIVIMGGYRGSILRDAKTGKRAWIPFKAGFNLRRINLLLGPTLDDELKATDLIYPDGVLKNVGPIDICKKLIKRLSSNPKANVKEFGYDWRLSGETLTQQLVHLLEDLYKTTGGPTIVIAHSMGGMIAHSAMQHNPKLFRGLVYVGAPSECSNILGPVRFGDSVLFSDKILTFETNFMMRSSFNFLPLNGRIFLNKQTKEYYDLDYFDPETWVEYDLNPLVSSSRRKKEESKEHTLSSEISSNTTLLDDGSNHNDNSSFPSINTIGQKLLQYRPKSISRKFIPSFGEQNSESSNSPRSHGPCVPRSNQGQLTPLEESSFSFSFDEAYEYLRETLARTKKFKLGFKYNPELESEYPPLAMVYGNIVPSVRGAFVNNKEDIKNGNFYNLFYGHGDGVVHQKWLLPAVEGFKIFNEKTGEGEIVGKFPSECGHVSLMSDLKTMGYALSAIWEADKIWKAKKEMYRKKHAKRRTSSIEEENS
ncbi:Piso0_005648 [Millerozyma farinosa CBS 7064]|uniref:Piso0_005648 protein n=1 Tax=Pichia sorbitophila (strain ATCC MYA-4447 / BCRC 22081 / CBS 7064 / NBRC 10061 / NRRL Y-12695) TaxID=559304 RepID=G8Y2J3_PICSO|nr:Piso0_005648 [Millerozyma farinosa CBS 7064]